VLGVGCTVVVDLACVLRPGKAFAAMPVQTTASKPATVANAAVERRSRLSAASRARIRCVSMPPVERRRMKCR